MGLAGGEVCEVCGRGSGGRYGSGLVGGYVINAVVFG